MKQQTKENIEWGVGMTLLALTFPAFVAVLFYAAACNGAN